MTRMHQLVRYVGTSSIPKKVVFLTSRPVKNLRIERKTWRIRVKKGNAYVKNIKYVNYARFYLPAIITAKHIQRTWYERDYRTVCVRIIKYMLTREKYFPRNTGTLARRQDFRRRTFTGACSKMQLRHSQQRAPRPYFFFSFFFVCSTSDDDAGDSDDDVDVEGRKSGCKWRKNFSTCICAGRETVRRTRI